MNFWEALLLGIVQGVTEFLPISSSGHLILVQRLLGLSNLSQYVFFDLVCHMGTLGAILVVFKKEIASLFSDWQQAKLLLIATLPLFPLVPFVKYIKHLFDQPDILGISFLATAFILFIGYMFGRGKQELSAETSYRSAFLIGLSQCLAVIPGISRSGTTISTALLLHFTPYRAVSFSFLLSIPTILGGMALEIFKLTTKEELAPAISFSAYFAGFLTSLIVGYLALRLLIRIVGTAKFQYFSWYCALLGLLLIFLL